MYPNPARDWAYLDADRPIAGLTLFQTNGQVVKRWGALPENHPIDLSPLPEGVYYLEIWLGEQRVVRKIVKMQ